MKSTIFNQYKFHCSSVGNIMSGVPKPLTERQEETYKDFTKRKNGEGRPLTDNQYILWADLHKKKFGKCELTDGVKKYLVQLVWEHLSGRSTTLYNKFFDKGNDVEEKSLTAYSEVKDSLVLKNQETKENEYLIGTADIAHYKIRDIKSSWSWHTFPLTSDTIPSKIYEWQLDGYMMLWNLKRAELIYSLVDTPFKLIDDELRRLDWKFNIMTPEGDFREEQEIIDLVVETICGHIYTFEGLEKYCHQSTTLNLDWFVGKFKEVPEEIRVKIFKHNRDEKRIGYLKEMVDLARKYMNGVVDEIGENAFLLHQKELV